jgi:hypothetical protein
MPDSTATNAASYTTPWDTIPFPALIYKLAQMKAFSLVAHLTDFQLTEISISSVYTRYSLRKGLTEVGEIELLSHLSPCFSVSEDERVAIYAGSLAYFPEDKSISMYEEEEEIHRLWFLNEGIFSVCDTSLVLRGAYDFCVKNRYWHDEIIVAGVFQSRRLFYFQDLQNRVFSMDVASFEVSLSNYPFAKLT